MVLISLALVKQDEERVRSSWKDPNRVVLRGASLEQEESGVSSPSRHTEAQPTQPLRSPHTEELFRDPF